MKAFTIFVLLTITGLTCFGDDTNQIFTGNWSETVGGLRMRFIVSSKQERADFCRAAVYLEMQNVSNVINPIEFNSSFSLNCTLTNSAGNPPPSAMCFGSGFVCPPYWIYVPFDSTLKLRVDDMNSWSVGLKGQTGVSMAVGTGCWLVPDNTTNEYFLTGVFKEERIRQPEDHIHAWDGTIQLPRVKIHFQK
ncbi:MAG: hypothetical protein PHY43_10865 [Verrucomicrobiales bacterium]|nr:hypothetical protein [Verrucomicrobiales bacterium]